MTEEAARTSSKEKTDKNQPCHQHRGWSMSTRERRVHWFLPGTNRKWNYCVAFLPLETSWLQVVGDRLGTGPFTLSKALNRYPPPSFLIVTVESFSAYKYSQGYSINSGSRTPVNDVPVKSRGGSCCIKNALSTSSD